MSAIFRRHAFAITLLALVFWGILFTGDSDGEISRLSGLTMGTSYELQVVDLPQHTTLEQSRLDVASLLQRLDREVFSTYAPQSELSRFNAVAAGETVQVSPDLFAVLALALIISDLSNGAFDVTVGPLVDMWGFGPDPRVLPEQSPSSDAIARVKERVGYQYLELDEESLTVTKLRDVRVDLSAIAKGYAVDKVGDYFDSLGVASYFLEIGGELKMKGLKPGGLTWVPAIEAPVDSASQIYEIFFSHGEHIAVAGSGDYRNYFEQDGQRYSHEIDPRTGRPISHDLAAAYVIDDTAARADGFATAYMIMGREAAIALAESIAQPIYLIYKDENGDFADYTNAAFSHFLEE